MSFEDRLSGLMASISLGPDSQDYGSLTIQLERQDHERVTSLLSSAAVAYRAGYQEEGWFFLTLAAEMIGNHQGAEEAKFYSSGESAVIDQLRQFGRRGGLTSRDKFVALRDKAAAALLENTPKGGWPSKAAFELAYHPIVIDILGEHHTEHQRKALLKRDDIRATLPRTMKRRR